MLAALKCSESLKEKKNIFSTKELGKFFYFLLFYVKRIEPEVLSVTQNDTVL